MGHPKQPGQDADAHRAVTEQALALTKENKRLRAALAEAERDFTELDEIARKNAELAQVAQADRKDLAARVATLESENRGLREEAPCSKGEALLEAESDRKVAAVPSETEPGCESCGVLAGETHEADCTIAPNAVRTVWASPPGAAGTEEA